MPGDAADAHRQRTASAPRSQRLCARCPLVAPLQAGCRAAGRVAHTPSSAPDRRQPRFACAPTRCVAPGHESPVVHPARAAWPRTASVPTPPRLRQSRTASEPAAGARFHPRTSRRNRPGVRPRASHCPAASVPRHSDRSGCRRRAQRPGTRGYSAERPHSMKAARSSLSAVRFGSPLPPCHQRPRSLLHRSRRVPRLWPSVRSSGVPREHQARQYPHRQHSPRYLGLLGCLRPFPFRRSHPAPMQTECPKKSARLWVPRQWLVVPACDQRAVITSGVTLKCASRSTGTHSGSLAARVVGVIRCSRSVGSRRYRLAPDSNQGTGRGR